MPKNKNPFSIDQQGDRGSRSNTITIGDTQLTLSRGEEEGSVVVYVETPNHSLYITKYPKPRKCWNRPDVSKDENCNETQSTQKGSKKSKQAPQDDHELLNLVKLLTSIFNSGPGSEDQKNKKSSN